MSLRHLFKISALALIANKSRSALTILGIVIGVASIIMVMSIGQGAEALIINQIQGIGARSITVEPGRMPQGAMDFAEIFTDSLKNRELQALKKSENVRGAVTFTPLVVQSMTLSYGREAKRGSVFGSSPGLFDIFDLSPAEGDIFSDEEVRSLAPVVVLGANIKEDLFGYSDAVGEKIRIKDRSFRVIGVMGKAGQVGFMNMDDMVIVPYTTAQTYLMGIDHFHSIIVEAESEEIIDEVAADIVATLREVRNITDPDKDDFHVMTQADAAEMISAIMGILSALLIAVAAISLVVGGIGIMNIMLVSVTERTREIGLRKAIGATYKNILHQFLVEAVILTAAGGIIGIVFGAFLSYLVSIILTEAIANYWPFVFPIFSALLGILISTAIGLIFGIYPARKAAIQDPIEALRYE